MKVNIVLIFVLIYACYAQDIITSEILLPYDTDNSTESSVEEELEPLPNAVTVRVAQGEVEGYLADDGRYHAFYGIPYAGPTSGENRFKGPTPASSFGYEVFHANDSGILCAQFGSNGLVGVEDCLTINVFTDNIGTNTTLKPVIVWLTGEEYKTSNPLQYSFKNFIEFNLIAVTLNYRLSVFGFLCLGIEEAPGNAGLKDVIQGLEWVQQNIEAFGGDPNNVVLMGHGSGAAMVDLITLSQKANGLVHKAILHSGSAMAPWAVSYDPVGSARALANTLGFVGNNRRGIAELLSRAPANAMIAAMLTFQQPYNNTVLFAPCVEDAQLNSEDVVLHKAPFELFESEEYLHIPHIYVYTDKEGTIRHNNIVNGQWLQRMETQFESFLPVDLELSNLNETEKATHALSVRQFYFDDNTINSTSIEQYFDYHGDTAIIVPVLRSAILRSWKSTSSNRVLEFRYIRTTSDMEPTITTGVPHGGILNFIFNVNLGQLDLRIMRSIMQKYTAFIYTGETDYDNHRVSWLPISNNVRYYITISGGNTETPGVGQAEWVLRNNPHVRNFGFWENLYEEHYWMPTSPSSAARAMVSIALLFSLVLALF